MGLRREFLRRRSRGRLPAVLAVLAMLTQLMIPVAALAAELAPKPLNSTVVCTADGAVEMSVPDPAHHDKGFAGLQCHSCVMASVAAIAPGEPVVVPVSYAAGIQRVRAGRDHPQAQTRAPPRPPSTAPPVIPNA